MTPKTRKLEDLSTVESARLESILNHIEDISGMDENQLRNQLVEERSIFYYLKLNKPDLAGKIQATQEVYLKNILKSRAYRSMFGIEPKESEMGDTEMKKIGLLAWNLALDKEMYGTPYDVCKYAPYLALSKEKP